MTVQHAMLALNVQFPGFSGSPALTDARARLIADLINDLCDVAALSECGRDEAAKIARFAGQRWNYDRAQGDGGDGPGEGLNAIIRRRDVWHGRPGKRLRDVNLRSHGQWQRTLLLVPLADKEDRFLAAGATHLAAVGAPLGRAGANAAKLDQVRQLVDVVGDGRALIGLDLPRTDDDDDVRLLEREGWTLHGRTDATPLVNMSHGAIRAGASRKIDTGRACDHDAMLTPFTLPETKP